MPAWRSTERIAQMTGSYDPEGKAHFRDTSLWRVPGTDLGANTVLGDRTFIFFGDVPTGGDGVWPPQNSDFVAFVEDVPMPGGARVATARQADDQVDAFFIGADGGLYVSWVTGAGVWQGPLRVSRTNVAPPGAAVATGRQSVDQLDVFFIGRDGALYVAWVIGGGVWQGPARISRRGVAEPGGYLAAERQTDDQLTVVYIGRDQRLNVQWVVGGGVWQGPVAVSPNPVAPPGAGITAFRQQDDLLTVAFFGHDRRLNVQWVVGGGVWGGPVPVSPNPVAPPGSCLTAFRQLEDQVTVAFIGSDGKLNVHWVEGAGTWQGPVPVSPNPIAQPGAGITAAPQLPGQWTVAYLGVNGEMLVQWVVGGGVWQGPVPVTPGHVGPAGGPISAIMQRDDLMTVVHGGAGDELNVEFVVGGGVWQGPFRINPPMVNLWPVLGADGAFQPFTLREGQRTWLLGSDATPTGAFTFDDRVFVFVLDVEGGNLVSSLTQSRSPGDGVPFDVVFQLSNSLDGPAGERFWQVAPCVVSRDDVPGLRVEGAEGAVLVGQGASHLGAQPWSAFYLAWLPLTRGQDPDVASIRFYTGAGGVNWSPSEADARPLFLTTWGWASLSLCHVGGKWVLLYHRAGTRDDTAAHDAPIVARIADTPWDLAVAREVVVHDPVRDHALGNYMYRPGLPDPNDLEHAGGPIIHHPSFLYGPHVLRRYTEIRGNSELVLHYLVSTGWPYQVQLMRTVVAL
jgi:hypothetical protein